MTERIWRIYQITGPEGRLYFGLTKRTIHQRWILHRSKSSTCSYLHRAIVKHGEDSFLREELVNGLTRDEANEYEKLLIAEHRRDGIPLYNITDGGDGHFKLACKRGHSGEERGTRDSCKACRKVASREWAKKNREADPEAYKAYHDQYYANNKAAVNERNERWRQANKERVKAAADLRRVARREIINTQQRARRAAEKKKALIADLLSNTLSQLSPRFVS